MGMLNIGSSNVKQGLYITVNITTKQRIELLKLRQADRKLLCTFSNWHQQFLDMMIWKNLKKHLDLDVFWLPKSSNTLCHIKSQHYRWRQHSNGLYKLQHSIIKLLWVKEFNKEVETSWTRSSMSDELKNAEEYKISVLSQSEQLLLKCILMKSTKVICQHQLKRLSRKKHRWMKQRTSAGSILLFLKLTGFQIRGPSVRKQQYNWWVRFLFLNTAWKIIN